MTVTIPALPTPLRRVAALAPLLLVLWVAANAVNYVSIARPGADAGEYASGAMLVGEGRVLYRDIMEVKPPMIYALNALALRVGDGTFHSVRLFERAFAIAGALLVFFLVRRLFGRPALAAVIAIAFTAAAFSDPVFEEGNVTEEYAVVLALAGMLCASRVALDDGSRPAWLSALAGACFSGAVFTKEPFLFSSAPWFLWIVVAARADRREAARRGGAFVAGALAPLAALLVYLGAHGGVLDWVDKLTGSLHYVSTSRETRSFLGGFQPAFSIFASRVIFTTAAGLLALAGGLAATVVPVVRRRYHGAPVVAAVAILAEFTGAALSGRPYGHYLLQVLPSFMLCCAAGGALLLDACDWAVDTRGACAVLLVLIPGVLDPQAIEACWQRLRAPFGRSAGDQLVTYVTAHAAPGDHLWSSSAVNSRFYVETGLTSPTGFHQFDPIWFTDTLKSTGAEKLARLRGELSAGAPAWVVLGSDVEALDAVGLMDWVCANYVRTPIVGQGATPRVDAALYVSNQRAAGLDQRLGQVDDPACAAVDLRASIAAYARRDWRGAVEAGARAATRRPNNAAAHSDVCAAYIQLGDFDRAIAACQAAVAADPSLAIARNNLAWAQASKAGKPPK